MPPITEAEIASRKAYLNLTVEDERHLRDVHPILTRHTDTVIDRFYEYLFSQERTRKMLQAPGLVERLKALQRPYFNRLTAGTYDLSYFQERLKVGQTHERVGLAPELYFGAFHRYWEIATEVLLGAFPAGDPRYHRTIVSLAKIVTLDMSLAIDAYIERAQAGLHDRNTQLAGLQRAKQMLTDMIVHDLQNPLTGIRAFLEVLARREEGLSETEQEALTEALRRCDDLGQMMMNVLQVSRAETGNLEVNVENIDVAELARRSVSAFALHAEHEGRSIRVDAPGALSVRSDQSLLKRVLYNLIRNALRHTPRGTRIVVRVAAGGHRKAEISVSDNGPGIPPDVQHLLFERYGGPALRAAGLRIDTGLGLAFCRSAIEALGGTIAVESDGKSGTSFRVVVGSSD